MFFINIVFRPCYLFLLWNVVLKCLALCLITIIAAYFLHLYACLTCSFICTCLISSPIIVCPPSSVLCWCLLRFFFLLLIYATFLCDSILDCLCTYFCLIAFFYTISFWLCVFIFNVVFVLFVCNVLCIRFTVIDSGQKRFVMNMQLKQCFVRVSLSDWKKPEKPDFASTKCQNFKTRPEKSQNGRPAFRDLKTGKPQVEKQFATRGNTRSKLFIFFYSDP